MSGRSAAGRAASDHRGRRVSIVRRGGTGLKDPLTWAGPAGPAPVSSDTGVEQERHSRPSREAVEEAEGPGRSPSGGKAWRESGAEPDPGGWPAARLGRQTYYQTP